MTSVKFSRSDVFNYYRAGTLLDIKLHKKICCQWHIDSFVSREKKTFNLNQDQLLGG